MTGTPSTTAIDTAFETIFITDQINGGTAGDKDKYFDGGQTKDTTNIPSWLWTTVSEPQDKNDIAHAYAAAYRDNGDLVVYVGMDRYAANGAGQVGWWFLQGDVRPDRRSGNGRLLRHPPGG